MTGYRVVAVSDELSERVRTTLKSPQYGHPAFIEIANGCGPCRSCLRKFEEGKEERVLFTYNPFEGISDLPAPGPIFVHREDCKKYEGETFPEELRDLLLVLDGHKKDGMLTRREQIEDGGVDERIQQMLKDPDIEYIQVRNGQAGCFITRIERTANDN